VMAIFRGANLESEEEKPRGAPFLSGKIGPYSLIRHLGSGGIGSVYLVERMVGGALQRSALKVLAPHAAGPSFVERFHREQHILASLDHPNITRMLDGGLSEGGQPYLVMETSTVFLWTCTAMNEILGSRNVCSYFFGCAMRSRMRIGPLWSISISSPPIFL
jgi:serine/threonine protein kinase